MRSGRWSFHSPSLALLEDAGPFDHSAYRDSWIDAFPEWRDVSFAARMADGTRAAVSLLQRDRIAESIPHNYGTLVASRPLGEREAEAFLEQARAACGARQLIARSVPLRPTPGTCHSGARVRGWSSVVYIEKGGVLEPRYGQSARHSIRKAAGAGAEILPTSDPAGFLPLYATASSNHWMQYPERLIRSLASAGIVRFFDVRLGSDCVASVLVLTSRNHWTAWLAAQNERGRSIDANYFAVGQMLAAAQRASVPGVNLGISLGMPGVAHFKRQFDCIEIPLVEYRLAPWSERARDQAGIIARRGARRIGRVLNRRRDP